MQIGFIAFCHFSHAHTHTNTQPDYVSKYTYIHICVCKIFLLSLFSKHSQLFSFEIAHQRQTSNDSAHLLLLLYLLYDIIFCLTFQCERNTNAMRTLSKVNNKASSNKGSTHMIRRHEQWRVQSATWTIRDVITLQQTFKDRVVHLHCAVISSKNESIITGISWTVREHIV